MQFFMNKEESMEDEEIVELTIVCPSCKEEKQIKMDLGDPETEMLIDYATTTCKNCGLKSPFARCIDHNRTKICDASSN
jgi:hypothetical protein